MLNLDDATPVETALAYATIASSRRVHEIARPIIVVSEDSTLRSLLEWSAVKRQVLLKPTLDDALRFLGASRWLSTFAEVGAYASTRP